MKNIIKKLKVFYGNLCPHWDKCPYYREMSGKCHQPMGFDGFKLCNKKPKE